MSCLWSGYIRSSFIRIQPLLWRHNGHSGVSNHQPHDSLLNRLFRRRPKKTSKLRVTGLCAGNYPGTGEFHHKWPVTRKMFPFDDVIMYIDLWQNHVSLLCSWYITASYWFHCHGFVLNSIINNNDTNALCLNEITMINIDKQIIAGHQEILCTHKKSKLNYALHD